MTEKNCVKIWQKSSLKCCHLWNKHGCPRDGADAIALHKCRYINSLISDFSLNFRISWKNGRTSRSWHHGHHNLSSRMPWGNFKIFLPNCIKFIMKGLVRIWYLLYNMPVHTKHIYCICSRDHFRVLVLGGYIIVIDCLFLFLFSFLNP